jgi:hypothetical protein
MFTRRELSNSGLDARTIDRIQADFLATSFDFHSAKLRSSIAAERAALANTASALRTMAGGIDQLVVALLADPGISDDTPQAHSGGPYLAVEGNELTLDGTGSTSGTGHQIVTYEWDLDRDGSFDDASGTTPRYLYPSAFDGYVGLRVTDEIGRATISYAYVSVGEANRPPQIKAATPVGIPEVSIGETEPFTVEALDPDGDALSVQWLLDDSEVARGPRFDYRPSAGDAGTHVLRARVSDGTSAGGSAVNTWVPVVLAADGDGDGYRANAECNDADPAVNPGALDILGNRKDDNCDGLVDGTSVQPPRGEEGGAGAQLFATGGPIEIEVTPSEALFTSELWLFAPGSARFLASNKEPGKIVQVGIFPPDTELVFGIRVLDTGSEFRTGPGERNVDGALHGFVERLGPGRLSVGFEDRPQAQWGPDDPDYNDATFEFRGAVTARSLNRSPVVVDDKLIALEDNPMTVPSSALLVNDSDPDNNSLVVTSVSATATTRGTVAFESGIVTYTPAANYNGPADFAYTVSDGRGGSATATVALEIVPQGDGPSAADVAVSTRENTAVTVTLRAADPDGDPIGYEALASPSAGTLTGTDGQSPVYQPDPGFRGEDSFTYRVSTTDGSSSPATVRITVLPADNRPVGETQGLSTQMDTPVTLSLRAMDPANGQLRFGVTVQPAHGTISEDAGGKLAYIPAPGYQGRDAFFFTATSTSGLTSLPRAVIIDVVPRQSSPGPESENPAPAPEVVSPRVSPLNLTRPLGSSSGAAASPRASARSSQEEDRPDGPLPATGFPFAELLMLSGAFTGLGLTMVLLGRPERRS